MIFQRRQKALLWSKGLTLRGLETPKGVLWQTVKAKSLHCLLRQNQFLNRQMNTIFFGKLQPVSRL